MLFDSSAAKSQLATFKRKKKFSDAEWEKRGLIPSSKAMCAQLEAFFDELASRLILVVNEAEPTSAAGILFAQALAEIDRDEYDTEEAELICSVLETLAGPFGLKLGGQLNSWLYGEELGAVATEQSEREAEPTTLETLSQSCTKCGAALDTAIVDFRLDNDSESWLSIECLACGGLNFLVLPPGIGSCRPRGYSMVSQYWRSKFTRESAEAAFKLDHAKRGKKITGRKLPKTV
jgi:Domain of unknown function (DUF4844)